MTVRTWFRLLRAEAWENGLNLGSDGITIYFRNETPENRYEPGPLRGPVKIYDIHDIQTIINVGLPPTRDYNFEVYGYPVRAGEIVWGAPSKDILN